MMKVRRLYIAKGIYTKLCCENETFLIYLNLSHIFLLNENKLPEIICFEWVVILCALRKYFQNENHQTFCFYLHTCLLSLTTVNLNCFTIGIKFSTFRANKSLNCLDRN